MCQPNRAAPSPDVRPPILQQNRLRVHPFSKGRKTEAAGLSNMLDEEVDRRKPGKRSHRKVVGAAIKGIAVYPFIT
jgi:hypothetical protein